MDTIVRLHKNIRKFSNLRRLCTPRINNNLIQSKQDQIYAYGTVS
mgnify:CR=1